MSTSKNNWVQDIHDMHTKFGVRPVIASLNREKLAKFLEFRLNFLQEELDEAKEAAVSGDPSKAEDVVDALIDLCVVAIGTLDAFGVDAYTAWNRVHEKNMQKEPGIKPERPNPLGLPDLIKPAGWTAPTHADNVGLLDKLF
jgi:predicted HAD superfamily Cof-like phosphohydrolase